ncbi:class I glutamine amidotransferase-like protein, partial [Cryphonectria parasitica EP155]
AVPLSYGLLIFPGFEVLDAAGPIELLNVLSVYMGHNEIQLSVIAATLDVVTPALRGPDVPGHRFAGKQHYLPTHTFDTAPALDVLIVPGGVGTFKPAEKIGPMVEFIRNVYNGSLGNPPLQYVFSICTGSRLFAEAGILRGHKATTNKQGWKSVTKLTDKTHWVAKARWVASGNIWTTSGVTAGMDGMVALIAQIYGDEKAEALCDMVEHSRQKDPENDPFA